jgi:hypothetical protein
MKGSQRMGFRTVIVAGCLAAAPLVAAFQGPLQEMLQRVQGSTPPKSMAVAQTGGGEAPGFRPLARAAHRADDPSGTGGVVGESASRLGERAGEAGSNGLSEKTAGSKRFSDSTGPGPASASTDEVQRPGYSHLENRRSDRRAFDAVHAEYQERPLSSRRGSPEHARSGGPLRDGAGQSELARVPTEVRGPIASPPQRTDPVTRRYERLRELGTTFSRLETWGPQGERFRFQCRVATGEDPTEARHFEATDSQPLGAIEKVLAEVEDWRVERR